MKHFLVLVLFFSFSLLLATSFFSGKLHISNFKFSVSIPTVFADEVDDLQHQINELGGLLTQIQSANSTNKQQLSSLEKQITSIQSKITAAKKQADQLSKSIDDRQTTLGATYQLFSSRVAAYYKTKSQTNYFILLLAQNNASTLTQTLAYYQQIQQRDGEELQRLSTEISQFEADKKTAEDTQTRLTAAQKSLDTSASFLKGEIAKADKAQSEISGKIANLSARQQQILAERTGTATTTVGDVPLADDPASQPTYNPGFSPAFAVFSFGAPHFKGMSQYGAYGRAKAGQSAEDILKAYYGSGIELKKDYSTGINITVQGYGSVDIETYVKRIYEMPGSWGDSGGMEALKAQAVAARSYALAYTNDGSKSICATEACQVYKPSNKGGKWDEAVDATKGWVLQANGKPFSSQYASTSGGYQQSYTSNGYSTPGFWDTTSDWTRWADGAYEVKAGSPWFYKAWYKSRSGDSCGKSHPWLTEQEFADILNAWVVRYHGNSDEVSRVTPLGSCNGGNPFSMDEMKQKADALGGAYTSVSSVRVEHGSNGYTKNVIVGTNRGSVTISGAEFKTAFNLRAPGRISVKGNLFGIEKK